MVELLWLSKTPLSLWKYSSNSAVNYSRAVVYSRPQSSEFQISISVWSYIKWRWSQLNLTFIESTKCSWVFTLRLLHGAEGTMASCVNHNNIFLQQCRHFFLKRLFWNSTVEAMFSIIVYLLLAGVSSMCWCSACPAYGLRCPVRRFHWYCKVSGLSEGHRETGE